MSLFAGFARRWRTRLCGAAVLGWTLATPVVHAALYSRCVDPIVLPDTQVQLFVVPYQSENELTRETVGTGIGLALVRQLAAAMGARVDARNCEPGAEFRVEFPPH